MIKFETLNCNGQLVDLEIPKVMGVLNFNQDSFYKDSRIQRNEELLTKASEMIAEGVQFIDLGAMSSRPGAKIIPPEVEQERLGESIRLLRSHFPDIPISIDTIHSPVAHWALDEGVGMINDISGGLYDNEMMSVVSRYPVPLVIMHMQGLPEDMQIAPQYKNVVLDVFDYFTERIELARAAGIVDLILDPGIGFGKTITHNFSLIKYLDIYDVLRYPMLIGVSRKSFIRQVLNVEVEGALNGSTAVHMYALTKGVKILRVHDVRPAVEAIKIWSEFNKVSDELL